MGWVTRCTILFGFAIAMPSAASAQQADAGIPTVASVSTLQLQDTIRSWGRLGGMASDRLGFLYISSFGDAVWRVTPDGVVTKLADDLYGASGMTIGADGALYVGSFFENSVRRIGRDGEVTTWATGLHGPVGIASRPDGTLFVVNCTDRSVSEISPDGTESTLVQSDLFACPNGIVLKNDGLYIVNFSNNNLVKVDFDGNASVFATIGEATGRAAGHAHIATAGQYFFVTSIKTNSLWRVGPDGSSVRLLGSNQPDNVDGTMAEARIANPNALISAGGPMGPLFLNTIVPGKWGTTTRTQLFIRRVELEPEGD